MSRIIDLTERRFGRLVVVERAEKRPNSTRAFWKCVCDCGETTVLRSDHLMREHAPVRSCGCIRDEATSQRFSLHLEGETFGSWTVVRRSHLSRSGRGMWHCQCACGKTAEIHTSNLTRRYSQSCGCDGEYGIHPDDPAIIYLIRHEGLNAAKVGIAKKGSMRLAQHSSHGWEMMLVLEGTGLLVRRAEQAVLDLWRATGVPEGASKEQMPQFGHTETAPLDRVDFDHVCRLLVESLAVR